MNKRPIYITGAGGMIGSHLSEYLTSKGEAFVYGSYYTPTTDIDEIKPLPDFELFELDIRDHKKVLDFISDHLPDPIYHLAAQSRPQASWIDPYYTFDVNVNGTIGLFEAVREAKKNHPEYDPKIVVITSSAVYGDALLKYDVDNLPDESCPMEPLHPYGVSKAAEDMACYQYFRNYDLKIVRVRLFNCTGTRKIEDVTGDFTHRAVELEMVGDNHLKVGNLNPLRAIIDVNDVCSALEILANKGQAGEAYNLCSSHIIKIKQVVRCIEEVMGVKYELVTNPSLLRVADERLYAGDSSKLKALGWEEKREYIDTVRDMIAYWRKKLKK